MAKSARASSKKANRTKLRARVFGPAEKARAERLHAKLLETIQQPKPEKTDMDIAEDTTTEEAKDEGLSKEMEIDGAATTTKKSSSKDKSQTRKQLRRKTQNKISFPTSRGKGALKPYSGSRVGKRRS